MIASSPHRGKEELKSQVRVEILGREYILRTDEDEERVKIISEYINQKIKEVSENLKNISTLNIAILAALNIANDYFEAIKRRDTFKGMVEAKSNHIIELINAQIH